MDTERIARPLTKAPEECSSGAFVVSGVMSERHPEQILPPLRVPMICRILPPACRLPAAADWDATPGHIVTRNVTRLPHRRRVVEAWVKLQAQHHTNSLKDLIMLRLQLAETKGRLARFSIVADIKHNRFSFRIYPDLPTTEALGCSLAGYSPDSGMRGRSTELNAFITLVEDHIADFLADVATTPAAALLLRSSAATRTDFDGLTRY
jgi:hypothetical protein